MENRAAGALAGFIGAVIGLALYAFMPAGARDKVSILETPGGAMLAGAVWSWILFKGWRWSRRDRS